jgi:acetyl-CoA synthetase
VMKEYWKNPGAMAEKFINGWCISGDNGHMDDEGYIYFQGRSDDVIKTSGYRVGPAEVEAKIIEHPAVASCAVVGVPDERRGQSIKAFVKLLPGHQPSQQMIDEIQKHVKTRLAAHEYPREFEFMDEFPVTVTGKIRRRDLREREIQRLTLTKKGQ